MKNNIKNIIIGVFSFVLLFVAGQNVFGAPNSVNWNSLSNDCNTIAIANKTQNIGFGNPCWVGQNISANSGDVIRVRVYYHNTGTSTANNTKIKITKSPSGNNSTNYNFSGQIISDSGTFYSINPSAVYLNVPANKTLDYVTTYWYPNQTSGGNGATLLYGQNGSEVLGSGLQVGNIVPGWGSQGTVIAEFKVNDVQAPNCTINSFTANPTSINQGGSSSLSWSTSNCHSVTLNNSNVLPNENQTVYPTTTTTYTLRAFNSSGVLQDTKTATVTVNQVVPTCSINNFTANPTSINQGASSTLSWSTSNCNNVTLDNSNVSTNGNQTVWPTTTTTYTLRAFNSSGVLQDTKTATVTVNQVVPVCVINNFTANPTSINQGASSTLSWSTSNCNNVTISNLGYNVPVNGVQQIWPNQTTTYTLTATGSSGSVQTQAVTVTVIQPQACAINNFTANPSSITSGQSSTLSWNTSNCNNVTLNNANVSTNGNQTVFPTTTTNYVLRATGSSGVTQIMTVKVTVGIIHPVVCNINNFIANPTLITNGQSSTLSWSTSDCASVKLYNGNTLINTYYGVSGSQSVSPTQTTTYTLKGYSSNGTNTSTKTATVTVNNIVPQGCKINSFIASPTSINQGAFSTLSWSTSNCNNVTISNLGYNVPVNGVQQIWPNQTTTYTLTATGSTGQTQTRNVTVNVTNVGKTCIINNFTASPSSITSGQSSILSWNTSNCNSVSMGSSELPPVGTQVVWPNQTTTYTLTATGSSGPAKTRTVTVYVNNIGKTCTINSFIASPSSITSGQSSILSWNTSNCNSVSMGSSEVSPTGNQTVWPNQTTTYTLTATGSTGQTQTRNVTVIVNNTGSQICNIHNFEASPSSIVRGDSSRLSWSTNGCQNILIQNVGTGLSNNGNISVSPTSTTTYILRAMDIYGYKYSAETTVTVRTSGGGGGGGGGGGSIVCRINSFDASRTNINQGESVVLNWNTTNCNNANISGLGNISVNGSQIVYPNSSMTYVLTASRGSSVVTRNIFINVNAGNIYNADVVTTVATNITQNSALLNGLITNQNYSNSNVYFEYGTTVGLGSRTSSRPVSGSMNFSDQIVNLSPNTIYYFRAVGEGPSGVSRGAIEVFRTLRTVTYTNPVVNVTQPTVQTIVQGTTVFGSSSPIVLRIENKYQYIGQGDIIDYVVFYKNISSSKLTRPMIQVFIPSGISLLNFSRGTYSNEDRTLSIPLDDLEAGDEGIIYLQARVDFLEISLAQIVTTAILVYTNPNGAQENAMAYVLNNPKVDNLLGASAFFSSGRILGMNLIHWLLLIIFVMLLILLSRTYSQRHRTNNHQ